ncbi:hypothetical protein [Nocardioides sp. T2.26MG-1]|uniref:hypothetical protein n=1 Tax=Nocardioides sp. T2.26MG-1 TaxID=3041166 RepID=UPI002477B753|nr:hypothetical protein [Nocardioides sp. T2.26MG-1]CAI9413556.1 hypothetical protein HIDPHFAB_02051 [Nocardioides sp. T2.26MG-1]
MAEHGTPGSHGQGLDWLTPIAAGIAGLTLATLGLLTSASWTLTVQGWLNRNGSSSFSDGVVLTGLVQVAVAGGALLLARRALRSLEPAARHLGGAAVVVGGVGMLVAVLTVLVGIAGF